ncbi:DUF3786 domain-containing protein [Desulfopila sp. IMCC35008]|uniref:DUF3786 domain-containing protein n=1 Tax=Desulfopila sp. IMCC35008 TaxID=2653858 RepID=UPI0013D10BD0|nr:DUF3786 domain-containing protein [Desulfopila sp. IMCC35008]
MATFNNAMEVFKLLEKTNCRKCNKPTCLAFAGAVYQGQATLRDCPFIDANTLMQYDDASVPDPGLDFLNVLNQLKEQIKATDLEYRAHILGETFANDRLTLKIFGKDFSIDVDGNVYTDLHVNHWLVPPVLKYILYSKGQPVSESWVPFRELETSKDWARFFDHQCVRLLKKIADSNPSFFEDIISLFNGKPVEDHYDADISLIIKPLPLLPILFCYNNPEDGLESDLNLFFDFTADKNLPVEDIYILITGLAKMFEKLAVTHT